MEEAADQPPPADWIGPHNLPAPAQKSAFNMPEQAEETKVQPAPKELAPGCKVSLHGLKNAAELNGQRGVLEAFVQETSRWRIKLENGQVKDLRPDNVKLDEVSAEVLAEVAAFDAELEEDIEFHAGAGDACGPGGRFIIQEQIGEGTFSTVFRCTDSKKEGNEYAVKFTRSDPETRKALEKEIKLVGALMTKIGGKDPEGIRCILNLAFFEGFTYRGRLAAVFELMKCNLRTALEKYGAGKGLPLLPSVRNFGRQVFLALRALRSAGLIHCDVKPHNLLLSRDGLSIKLSDFGTCHGFSGRVFTDQLMPRHYRAPEVALGQEYTSQVDIWSAGATLFELATGYVLFRVDTNNDLLHEVLKVCGAFPKTFALTGSCALNHFNSDAAFLNAKGDMAIGSMNPRVRPMASFDPPSRPLPFLLQDELTVPPKGVPLDRHHGLVQHLTDLLSKCLLPDPSSRATPDAALVHRFFQRGA
eukprot:TRINITY_DN39764_c0_g1_i1.p1 TRINITY_DN39764_c0_g1~~TRINITY_DN39764_c0_g1_i1.p1  ORF type:complete len:554 (+),score=110.53 TRINITY_DN39764_c0_g1_i1:242-1663(+)